MQSLSYLGFLLVLSLVQFIVFHNTASFCKCFLNSVHLPLHSVNRIKQTVQSEQCVKYIVNYFHLVFSFADKQICGHEHAASVL